LSAGAELHNVLSLELKDILERRIQSVIFRKGLTRSMKQARQFIVHRHITVGKKEITSPSYLVTLEEERSLAFKPKSTLAEEDHPERTILAVNKEEEKKEETEEPSEKPTQEEIKNEST